MLPIPPERWPPPVEPLKVDGLTFLPARNLHVILVGRWLGPALQNDAARRQAVREAFMRLDWYYTRTGGLLHLEKRQLPGSGGKGRTIGSIIERIDMPAMARFYNDLALMLGREMSIPPPHVTLYTAGRTQGIAVPDVATLRRLTVHEVHVPGSTPPDARPHRYPH
ncbi:MAG: hypothetical protein ABIP87_02515 [Thermomonas sp.]